MRHSKLVKLGLVLLFFVGSSSASAYSYRTCNGSKIVWPNARADMYISTTSFPANSTWDSRLQTAMWRWNNVKGSKFKFYVGRDTDGKHNSSNGKNEIYWDTSMPSNGALAVTKTRYNCYWLFGWHKKIKETDIGFNNKYSWSTGSYSYNNPTGSPYNFESVALHELGHSAGLKHENRWMASMNSKYPNSGPFGHSKRWDPFGDDRLGIRHLYPDSTNEADVAASPLKRTGSGTSNLVTSPSYAYRGTTVPMQFTFSNLSTSTKTFDIGFYLSTNSYISVSDTHLGTNYGAWGSAGATGTYNRNVYIPTSVSPGTYYLGFLVDEGSDIAEAVESNNRQEMPRTITIY